MPLNRVIYPVTPEAYKTILDMMDKEKHVSLIELGKPIGIRLVPNRDTLLDV